MTKYFEFCDCVHGLGDSHWYRRYCLTCKKLFCVKIGQVCPELKILDEITEKYICLQCNKRNKELMDRLISDLK